MIRRLLAVALVLVAEWSLVIAPAQAAINTPITPAQIPPNAVTAAKIAPLTVTNATAARPLLDRLTDPGYSVLDFGAKCDGSTDDTTAIQAAMDAAASLQVWLTIAPRGKVCRGNELHFRTGARLNVDGIYRTLAAAGGGASVLTNYYAVNRSGAPESDVVIRGNGQLDNNHLNQQPIQSGQSAAGSCLYTYGAIQNVTVDGQTMVNCGSFPWNIVGGIKNADGGTAQHVYLRNLTALGTNSVNAPELGSGCDDCWMDNVADYGPNTDFGPTIYGGATHSGIRNSRARGKAHGFAVLSDGTPVTGATSTPSQGILLEGNTSYGNYGCGFYIQSTSTASSGATAKQREVRLIGNDSYGNNLSHNPNFGGECVLDGSAPISMGNHLHNDGAANSDGSNSTVPSACILLYGAGSTTQASDNFKSIGDTCENEGYKGVGIGAVISSGVVAPSFVNFTVIDNQGLVSTTSTAASATTSISVASATNIAVGQTLQGVGVPNGTTVQSISGTTITVNQAVNIGSGAVLSFTTPTMVQAISGQCGADCTITGTKTSGFSSPWQGLVVNGAAKIWQNEGLSNYVQQDSLFTGAATVQGGLFANGGFQAANGVALATNLNAAGIVPGGTQGLAVEWNYSSGGAEADLFSLATNGPLSFYSKTGTTTAKRMMTLTPTSGAFDVPMQATGGFTDASSRPAVFAATAGPWTSYTPTLSCSSGTLTTATASGRYQGSTDKSEKFSISIKITTAGTCSGNITATLPVAAVNAGGFQMVGGRENAVGGTILVGQIPANGSGVVILAANASGVATTFTPANNWQLDVSGSYESQ